MVKFFKKNQKVTPRRRLDSGAGKTTKNSLFRRNSTIIGQLTYQDSLVDAEGDSSSRSQAHKLSRRRSQVMVIVGAGILITAVLFLLVINITAKVSVSVSNSQSVSKGVNTVIYESTIDDYLNNHPFDRLRFLFDNTGATSYVQAKHPEVANVQQGSLRWVGETSFLVTLREPIASWQMGESEFFVDSNGVPFEVNYFSRPSVQIIDDSGVEQAGEGAIISSRLLGFTGRLVVAADKFGYSIDKVVIPENTTRQIEVTFADLNYIVKFSIDRPAGEQAEDAHVAINSLKKSGVRSGVIDVRVSGRAFYK